MLTPATAHSAADRDRVCRAWASDLRALLLKISLACDPFAKSMNYLASALAVRPVSAKSQDSSHDEQCALVQDAVPRTPLSGDLSFSKTDDPTTYPKIKRQSTSVRRKTVLHFCRPPPSTRQKRLHLRPKVLLQLQKTSEQSRPIPVFDVLSTTGFASRFTKDLPSASKGRHGHSVKDIVVVGSEDYSSRTPEAEESDDSVEKDPRRKRDVVAAITHSSEDRAEGRGSTAEIHLNRGKTWHGSPLPRGGYEFVSVDQQGSRIVARWVPRKGSRKQVSSHGASPLMLTPEKVFNFSLIDPKSRRHAVIATFDSPSLEILDTYNTPSAETGTRPPTPTSTTEDCLSVHDSMEVDESLRILIIVTSVWVSFREGLFGYDQATAEESFRPYAPTSTPERRSMSVRGSQRHSITTYPSALGELSPRPTNPSLSLSSTTTHTSPANMPLMSPPFLTPPRRTRSTGTTILNRLHSRHTSRRDTATLYPIPDLADVSPFEDRPRRSLEPAKVPKVDSGSSAQLTKSKREQTRRAGGLKKLWLFN